MLTDGFLPCAQFPFVQTSSSAATPKQEICEQNESLQHATTALIRYEYKDNYSYKLVFSAVTRLAPVQTVFETSELSSAIIPETIIVIVIEIVIVIVIRVQIGAFAAFTKHQSAGLKFPCGII